MDPRTVHGNRFRFEIACGVKFVPKVAESGADTYFIMVATSIALSGMQSARSRFEEAAGNIARAGSVGVDSSQVVSAALVSGGAVNARVRVVHPTPDLAESVVAQKSAAYSFVANIQTIRTEQSMLGTWLDATV